MLARNCKSRLSPALLAAAMLVVVGGPALARDINLGGHREEQQHGKADNELAAKLPKTAVALPRVVATVQDHETGQWKRVLVDAYLDSKDSRTLDLIRDHLKDIAERTRPRLEARPAEFLAGARNGPREAKDCVRQAAEQSIGRSWKGEVYIRSLAVF